MTRLQRFRAYMARMNPVADPALAIREGLYVAPPGRSVAEELASGLELEPVSTHLVLGGIGSGKTSELLKAVTQLGTSLPEAGDHLEYIDVSQQHDLGIGKMSGVLTALTGLSLARNATRKNIPKPKSQLYKAIDAVRGQAYGKTEYWENPPEYHDEPPNEDEPEGYPVYTPGVLVAAEPRIPYDLYGQVQNLRTILSAYPGEGKHSVFLFDSLDRLPSPDHFRQAIQNDLRVLKAAGIGVTIVGPIRFLSGTDRSITDLFDHTHFQLATDPVQPEGLSFLCKVLRTRALDSFLPNECLEPLAQASGGLMRDLIALAKRAGEEAYATGNEFITLGDVSRAIDAFGRSIAIGLDEEQVKKLRHLHGGGGFVILGERELSLIETRRVLLHEQNRWVVHPALAPLLDAMPEAA